MQRGKNMNGQNHLVLQSVVGAKANSDAFGFIPARACFRLTPLGLLVPTLQ
jgi:hypothetical protein